MIRSLLVSVRPAQWTKNLFVLVAPLFARRLDEAAMLAVCAKGLCAFILVASGVYLVNDVADRMKDREHPVKCKRPVASGRLGVGAAMMSAVVLLLAGTALGFFLVRWEFGALLALYIVIQLAYSVWLRKVVLLDVFCIASGFVIRVMAGAFVVFPYIYISSWLILTTIFISLFLALCKRRAEAAALDEEQRGEHRETLSDYTLAFLDELIAVTSASVVICYSLYTVAERTRTEVGSRLLVLTVPFVVFGIFRYLFVVHRKDGGGSPIVAFAKDGFLAVNAVLWAFTVVGILYL